MLKNRPIDAPAIAAIAACEQAVQLTPWTAGMFHDSLAAGAEGWWLAEEEGRAVAYLLAQPTVGETEVLTLGVLPAWRRRGLAASLIALLVARANERQDERLLLEVRESSEGARAFYQRQGFVPIGRRPGYYPTPDGREAAILMARTL